MPAIFGDVIIGLILAGLAALAARSLWKSHKAGGQCSGDCSRCGGCHGDCHSK